MSNISIAAATKFGDTLPFSEPAWYDSRNPSPYYNDAHRAYRAKIRDFVDDEIIPNVEDWEASGVIPPEVFRGAAACGLLPAIVGWPEVRILRLSYAAVFLTNTLPSLSVHSPLLYSSLMNTLLSVGPVG